MKEDNYEFWKGKAIGRRLENKALKKRVKELGISRDKWKAKYMKASGLKDMYEKELDRIKKKLNGIIRN